MKLKSTLIRLGIFIISNSNIAAQSTCGIPDVLLFGTIQTDSTSSPYWESVSGATEYNVRYRIRNAGDDFSNPITTSDTTVTLTGLPTSTNYEFIVQSVCSGDTSAYSSSGWFTTLSGPVSLQITRGPFMTVPSNHKTTIQWSTSAPSNAEVRFGTSVNSLTDAVTDVTVATDHVITLQNLVPGTKYYYSVGAIGYSIEATSENYFYSPPQNNDSVPLKFWVTGDFGTGNLTQQQVRDAFVNYTSGQKVDGWLWLGDNAYSNGLDQEYQDKVFDVYPQQFRNIPVFPAPGNHDYAQSGYLSSASMGTNFPYFHIFSLPNSSGTEKYYSANYGNIHFIALDSYGSYNTQGSAMYNWLQSDLMNNTQQWTIVYFHHPPYSKGSHDSDNSIEMVDMRTHIIPLLESYGVDLVLSGHSHAYERSHFIKGHYGVESTFNSSHIVQQGGGSFSKTSRTGNGTVYVVCGVAGQVSSTTAGWPHNAMYYSTATKPGSLILDVTGGNLKCSFLTSTGSIADEFTMTKPAIEVQTAISENDRSGNQFEIYPNPANNEFHIYCNGLTDKTYTVKMYNQVGQVVFTKTIQVQNSNKILNFNKSEIRNCVPGIYYVSLIDDQNITTKALSIVEEK
jgi:hypothetical protein